MEPRSGTRRKLTPRCIVNYATSRWPAIHAYLLSAELPIYEHQHLHWNCLLVKTLAFEPPTRRKFLGSTSDAVIFQFDDNEVLVARLVPNNVSESKIGAHWPHIYDGADYQYLTFFEFWISLLALGAMGIEASDLVARTRGCAYFMPTTEHKPKVPRAELTPRCGGTYGRNRWVVTFDFQSLFFTLRTGVFQSCANVFRVCHRQPLVSRLGQ
jgi:hypothetical protein